MCPWIDSQNMIFWKIFVGFERCRIYCFGGTLTVKKWRNNKFRLWFFFFVLIPYNDYNYKLTFRAFSEAYIWISSMDSIHVLRRPWGHRTGHSRLNPTLVFSPFRKLSKRSNPKLIPFKFMRPPKKTVYALKTPFVIRESAASELPLDS
jgi:hypothetical protein